MKRDVMANCKYQMGLAKNMHILYGVSEGEASMEGTVWMSEGGQVWKGQYEVSEGEASMEWVSEWVSNWGWGKYGVSEWGL